MRVTDAVEQDLVYVHDEAESLPDGWKVTTLEGLISDKGLFCDGDWVESKDQDPNGDVRLIQLADIGVAAYRDRSDRYLASERASALSCTFLQRGDILVARMPDPLGRACLFPGDKKRAVTVVDVAVIRPNNPEVDCRWLMHRINSMAFRNAVASLQSGSTRLRISRRNLSRIAFPLPPLAVQMAVVDELEKQFSRLDEAVANLQRVKANLKRYKASVLKAAVEGRLVETEAALARREGRTYETGDLLLQRILEERRANWAGKGKYKEPVRAELAEGSASPDGWAHVSWEAVLAPSDGSFKRGPFGSALTKAIFVSSGYKVYEQYCPINDDCSFVRYYITPEKFEELKGFAVQAGDYLISCSGVTLGRITRVPEKFEAGVINQALLRVRLNFGVIDHRYFLHLFRGPVFQGQIFEQSAGAAIPNVRGVNELKAMPIPLPPLAEQQRIADEVDRHLSIIREVEAEVDANLQRAQALRQATLAKAFSPVPSNQVQT